MKTPLSRELAPVSISFLLRLFPFGAIIDKDMRILGAGDKLLQAWGGSSSSILNKHVTDVFKLRRPKGISFTWGNVREHFMWKISERVSYFLASFPFIFPDIKKMLHWSDTLYLYEMNILFEWDFLFFLLPTIFLYFFFSRYIQRNSKKFSIRDTDFKSMLEIIVESIYIMLE